MKGKEEARGGEKDDGPLFFNVISQERKRMGKMKRKKGETQKIRQLSQSSSLLSIR